MARPLTPREWQVAKLVAEEALSNDEIAERLGISSRTVKAHMDRIRDSLNIQRKRQIRKALLDRGML